MPQSLAKIYVHLIFGTKNRQGWLEDSVREELHSYIAAILKNWESPAQKIGSAADHIHILFMLSKNHSVSKIAEEIKKSSSKWLKTKDGINPKFQWQNGYGAFSMSQSKVEDVKQYIENQQEHHRKESFQEEFRRFLKAYNINFDEKYVWD